MTKSLRHVTPDVLVANVGTLFTFCPLTARAKEWIEENVETIVAVVRAGSRRRTSLRVGIGRGNERCRAAAPTNRLGGMTGEIFNVTAQRLMQYGCTEGQAYTLARGKQWAACLRSSTSVVNAGIRCG